MFMTRIHSTLYEVFFQQTSGKEVLLKKDDDYEAKSSMMKVPFQRQMTSLGRFALQTQTKENPNIIAFFAALSHEAGNELDVKDFQGIWAKRVMEHHERFSCQVSRENDHYFQIVNRPLDHYIAETQHPRQEEFPETIKSKLLSPMDVTKGLWDITLSSGQLGTSGAIASDSNESEKNERETLAFFRVHHSLCDGVSIAVAIGDLADEAAYLKCKLLDELKKKEQNKYDRNDAYYFLISTLNSLALMIYFVLLCIYALSLQFLKMIMSSNPFDPLLTMSEKANAGRSITWKDVTSLEEMRKTAKKVSERTTINDVACAMVTHAIKQQLMEHSDLFGDDFIRVPSSVNITVPVHLTGGILRPGDQLGNRIGGFVTTIPLSSKKESATDRLKIISKVLQREKRLPSPWISWYIARMLMIGPASVSKFALKKFSAHSVAIVSNVRGFPIPVHWLGRRVQSLFAFLPLQPDIPIGIVVSSYAGKLCFSLNADSRAVPDPELFSDWMIEEYERIRDGH